MTVPEVQPPKGRRLPVAHVHLLQQMFVEDARLVVESEFTEGQSPTTVYLVWPYDHRNRQKLPCVVKIGSHDLIAQAQAAEQMLQGKLHNFIAADPMTVLRKSGDATRLAGLRYQLAGGGIYPVQTLRDYLATAPSADLWRTLDCHLFPQLNPFWRGDLTCETLALRTIYERVLPVSLVVQASNERMPALAGGEPLSIDAGRLCDERFLATLAAGTLVHLTGLVVIETDERSAESVTVLFAGPATRKEMVGRIRLLLDVACFQQIAVGDTLADVRGTVVETRTSQLINLAQKALGSNVDLSADSLTLPGKGNILLPNPLHVWPDLLADVGDRQVSTIHGDLNMGNVLVDIQYGNTYFIDGAHARRDAVLYDLLRLEMDAVLHRLAAILFQHQLGLDTIHELYCAVHCAVTRRSHEAGHFPVSESLHDSLEPLFVALVTLRKTARDYMVDPKDWREYYAILALYLLGATKFRSLEEHPLGEFPAAVTFWGAATALWLMDAPVPCNDMAWRPLDLTRPLHGGGTLFFPLAALDARLKDLLRTSDPRLRAAEEDRQHWSGKVLDFVGTQMRRVTPSGLLKLLAALLMWALTVRLIGPILQWPLGDEPARATAAIQFTAAAWGMPFLIALAAQHRLPPSSKPRHWRDWQDYRLLKLTGAMVGFVSISGLLIALAVAWYHLSAQALGSLATGLLVILPLGFGYAAAQQLPIDRIKVAGRAAPNRDDLFVLSVFVAAGPLLATFLYWAHDLLIDGAAGLAIALAFMALLLWEMRARDPDSLSDRARILILGLVLPLAILTLALFADEPALSISAWHDLVPVLTAMACVLCGTLLLATLWVRNRPRLTLQGAVGLLAASVSSLIMLNVYPWLTGWWGLLLAGGWFLWGRRRYAHHLRFHPAFWFMAALIGVTLGLAVAGMVVWLAVLVYLCGMAFAIGWAYRKSPELNTPRH